MLRGLYTAASGMISGFISEDISANNLANINTAGFKKSNVTYKAFPEMLLSRLDTNGAKPVGSLSFGSGIGTSQIDFSQGDIRQSGNPLDMAIEGDGFFTLKDAKGELSYTRNGSFTINNQGFLVTHDGKLVQQGPAEKLQNIKIPNTGILAITEAGTLQADQTPIAKLFITRFTNNQTLEKQGNSQYKASASTQIDKSPPAPNKIPYKIHSQSLEYSNTNAIKELLSSISGLRYYEALQKNIHVQNETLGKAVNEVGKSV
ncbi:MAG: flagellar hook-basal body protein [Cyanobacteria bacterium]|nr:flagellar hook-basal body protein [Cyanobacteriota bacterium]